jgi:sulfur carrier protein
MEIQVNGQRHACFAGMTLTLLLDQLGMNPQLVVVEYNGEILGRSHWSTTELQAGDTLEVVTIVGGGGD